MGCGSQAKHNPHGCLGCNAPVALWNMDAAGNWVRKHVKEES